MDTIKVKDAPGFIRDKKTNAILNTNNDALQKYKKRKLANAKTENRINKMEEDISEIKRLLTELIKKD